MGVNTIKTQKFGIEIELTGLSRTRAAKTVANYFDTDYEHYGGGYDGYSIKDGKNRMWKIVSDASINTQHGSGTNADQTYSVELVSPICEYDDIETIQQIVRDLRGAGAIANNSTGIHVHINGAPYDAQSLRNLTNIMAAKEDLIYKALQVNVSRERSYCKKVDQKFLEALNSKKPKSLDKIQDIWYEGRDGSSIHYHDSRYHCLNLHSLFSKGTVEFRLFNSTTHAGKIKAYIQLCLAISHQALTQKCASRMKTQSSNEKYTFRTWLLRLGLIGDEFKTARTHLLENLDGCIAWKNPEDAIKQRERIKAEKEEQRLENVQNHEQDTSLIESEVISQEEQTDAEEISVGFSMSY